VQLLPARQRAISLLHEVLGWSAAEGAYLNRYITDKQRSRRPIFNATLWAAAGWLFFRVARSARPAPFLRRLRNGHTRKRQKWGGMGASLAP
jgi:hypothetical protein